MLAYNGPCEIIVHGLAISLVNNNNCEDGGPGSSASLCEVGYDYPDCPLRNSFVPPPSPPPPSPPPNEPSASPNPPSVRVSPPPSGCRRPRRVVRCRVRRRCRRCRRHRRRPARPAPKVNRPTAAARASALPSRPFPACRTFHRRKWAVGGASSGWRTDARTFCGCVSVGRLRKKATALKSQRGRTA